VCVHVCVCVCVCVCVYMCACVCVITRMLRGSHTIHLKNPQIILFQSLSLSLSRPPITSPTPASSLHRIPLTHTNSFIFSPRVSRCIFAQVLMRLLSPPRERKKEKVTKWKRRREITRQTGNERGSERGSERAHTQEIETGESKQKRTSERVSERSRGREGEKNGREGRGKEKEGGRKTGCAWERQKEIETAPLYPCPCSGELHRAAWFLCLGVCVTACVCMCVFVCVFACERISVHIQIYICVYAWAELIDSSVLVTVQVQVCVCVCTYIYSMCMYVIVCKHTFIHAYMCICIN